MNDARESIDRAFQPARGDLLYGRNETIAAYVDWLPAHLRSRIGRTKSWFQMDSYNNSYGTAFLYRKSKDYIDADFEASERKTPDDFHHDSAQRAAYKALVTGPSRFGIPATRRDFPDDSASWASSKLLRRLCKLGIGMVATHPAFRGPGSRIHFLLDGMDLKAAARKIALERPFAGNKGISYTTSELRYVRRNWSDLSSTVHLYVNTKRVAPPWEADWDLESIAPFDRTRACLRDWKAGEAERLAKYGGALPTRGLL